jgi:hypothetical protein
MMTCTPSTRKLYLLIFLNRKVKKVGKKVAKRRGEKTQQSSAGVFFSHLLNGTFFWP